MLLRLPYGTPRPVGRECAEKIKTWFTCYAWGLGCLCSRCVFADIPRVSSADMQGISLRRFFRFLAFSILLLNPWNSRAAEALASLSLSPLDDYPPGATRHDPSSSISGLNQKVKHGTRSWSRSSPLAKAGLRCTLTLDHERARELGCRSIDACRGWESTTGNITSHPIQLLG